ncbi:hypothetical protein [Embleya hyalina]|uniref:Uncharacterized protein n=1 Tax=Embleya hyalina TaxID=516124 RepID=A0A401YV04_9ACTN|nr:hypothetical protein [Embleya hyalina]GCD98448.1 hypothetical protein EHYA_06155 [Embleya hyalina]
MDRDVASISLQDGFHRRFVVGTVPHPVAEATDYPYALFAGTSFLILAALLAVVVVAAARTRLPARRALVAGWLVLPTGGYLFHEVGYFEQLLFLALFGAWWLLARGRTVAAALLMAVAVCVHEIAMPTVIPLFTLPVVDRLPIRRAAAVLAPSVVVGGVVLLVSPASDGAVPGLRARLREGGFPARADVFEIFGRTQAESLRMYEPFEVLWFLVPLAVLLAAAPAPAFAGGTVVGPRRLPAIAAAIAPPAAAFAGWDTHRWAFLLLANTAVVAWWWLGKERPDATSSRTRTRHRVLVAAALVCVHVPLAYFDGFAPRELTGPGIRTFVDDTTSGDLLRTPTR